MDSSAGAGRKPGSLLAYFVLAYSLSWIIGIPLALAAQGVIAPILPTWSHYLVAYGPLLAAILVTWNTEGAAGLSELVSRIFKWRLPPIWWIVALSPLIIGLLAMLVLGMAVGIGIRPAELGEVNFLPPLGYGALFLWILTFGIGEETGWRGYALPRLQQGRSALSATAILAPLWAGWHLPQFFYALDPGIVVGWAIGLFAGAIVFTWLFNSTGGSVLMVAIWHGAFNFFSASPAGEGVLAAVVSTIVMVWAVLVVLIFKPGNLSHRPKIVA